MAVVDPAGRVLQELHGIARGPGGAQLPFMGGLVPFRREVIWGEVFLGRTGFFSGDHPQAELFAGPWHAVQRRLQAADAVRAAVNAQSIRYPWPATYGANSNAYYATLLAGMGLKDVRAPGQLWAPSARRVLLADAVLEEIALMCECAEQAVAA